MNTEPSKRGVTPVDDKSVVVTTDCTAYYGCSTEPIGFS